ncbi:MAG TPA: ferrous iron transport protein B [Deferrisomatales bacterium]|nr:ferrous iron transport protein B [Deferrisomatales bacterium]
MSAASFTVAVAGNPNAGKTSLFNSLTGANQRVGNYPGVTVEFKRSSLRVDGSEVHLVDLPGTYSLTAYSPEELVARNYVIEQRPDVVIDVVDAANLERNLYLAVQLRELGVPMVLCLNMVDVSEGRGMRIDYQRLSEVFGVPVVPTVARTGQGVQALIRCAVDTARAAAPWSPLDISYGFDIDEAIAEISDLLDRAGHDSAPATNRWSALKCLEGDGAVLDRLDAGSKTEAQVREVCGRVSHHIQATMEDAPESIIADHRYGYIAGVSHQVLQQERALRMDLTDKVDRVLTHRLVGPLFLLGVIYGVYRFVFWASEYPVAWLESLIGRLGGVAAAALPEGPLQSLVVSGVIDGVGGVLGFVPLIMFMFCAIAIMEDSGYMARIAYLLDRVFRAFGLHGNSVMSLIVGGGLSGGCAVPGVMATRTLRDPQARLATILVVPFMNCGAKLPVYSLLIGAFFAAQKAEMMFALTLISWAMALLAAKLLRLTVLKGEQSPFVMELPPYRTPTLKGVLIHTWDRGWQYIKKAGTVLLSVSILMWAAMTYPGLPAERAAGFEQRIGAAQSEEARSAVAAEMAQAELAHTLAGRAGQALTVVTAPLGFDWRTNVALVGGFAAKEVIVSTLGTAYSLGEVNPDAAGGLSALLGGSPAWSPLKAFALMLFVMIYSPCIATVVMIRKETGSWGWTGFATLYTTGAAYLLALLVYQGGSLLGHG